MALLEVKDLKISFRTPKGTVTAVDGVSYSVEAGRTIGIVGESGSGKSVSALSILGLLDTNSYRERGEILFDTGAQTMDLAQISHAEMQRIRGNRISVIFQEPMTSLNPVFTIQRQLCEPFIIHQGMGREDAVAGARAMLAAVQIPNPDDVLRRYPHQLSGGMRQRVMIAMALACRPRILIADEPTTALDVTIQAEILRLMNDLQRENGTAIVFITHDLGVINEMADDVVVMYCGQVVEQCSARTLFTDCPRSHPYTEGLMLCVPRMDRGRESLVPIPGAVPHPLSWPVGCRFAPRCRYATQKCTREQPSLREVAPGQRVRCFYPDKEVRNSAEHRKALIHQESEKIFSR